MRFLAFLLVFVLGFIACIGAIAGGAVYAYKNISYDKLQQWNLVNVDVEEYVDRDAELAWTSASLSDLFTKITELSADGNSASLEDLREQLGAKIPAEVERLLPTSIKTIPLNQLFTSQGLNRIMDETTLNYLWQFIPDGILSAPAQDALCDKTLRQIIELNLTGLLSDVKLGYLFGVSYLFDEELGYYVIDYADPDHPTLMELFAPLNLGDVIASFGSSEDLLGVIRTQLGNVVLTQVVDCFSLSNPDLLNGIVKGKNISDLIHAEEDGSYTLDVYSLFNNRLIGDICGYTPVYQTVAGDAPGETKEIVVGWMDGNETVIGPIRGIYSSEIKNLGTDEFDFMDIVNDLYFGDVLELEPLYDASGEIVEWIDPNGGEVSSMNKKLASKQISEISSDDGLSALFDGMYVGDVLGYTPIYADPDDDTSEITGWKSNGEKVTGVNGLVAKIDLGKLTDSESGYEITDAFAGESLGTLLGYEKREGTWYDADNQPITGVTATISDYDAADVMNGRVNLSDEIDQMTLSEVLGLTAKSVSLYINSDAGYVPYLDFAGNPISYQFWYTDSACTTRASAVLEAIARKGAKVGDMSTVIDTLYIGDVVGYYCEYPDASGAIWYTVTDSGLVDGEGNPLYYQLDVATGIIASLAGLKVNQLSDSDAVQEKINDITIADVMGFEKEEATEKWYKKNTDPKQYVSGLMSVLAPRKVGALDSAMDEITIGEILGWKKVGLAWYSAYNDPEDPLNPNTKATGIMASFADLTVNEMSDNDKVSEKIKTVHIYDVMGYDLGVDGKWYNSGVPVTGIMSVLAPKTIAELDTGTGSILLGEIMGWTKVGSDWYTVYNSPEDPLNPNTKATGMMVNFASLTVDEMSDSDKMQNTVQSIKLCDVLGYEEHGGVWYSVYDSEHPENNQKADGFLSLLDLNTSVSGIGDETKNAYENATIGKLMDAGLLTFSSSSQTSLNVIFAGDSWKSMTTQEFLDALIGKLTP